MSRSLIATLLVLLATASRAGEATRLLPFQARLADASGNWVADGSTVLKFELFSGPTNALPVWAGESHRVTVNSGLVNVILGTKNPLPLNDPGDDSQPLFGRTLYLQVTPDANGDGKITDDPPLLPRQAMIPVLFAAESAVSRLSLDSAKLAGRDWSSILASGETDPTKGFLDGARLKGQSIEGDKLADGGIATAKLSREIIDTLVPTGVVLPLFSTSIPSGWIECDGRSLNDPSLVDKKYDVLKRKLRDQGLASIPDMRDSFIKGTAAGEKVGNTGGSNRMPDHTHELRSSTYPPGWALQAQSWVSGALPEFERVQPGTSGVVGHKAPDLSYSNAPKFVTAIWIIKY